MMKIVLALVTLHLVVYVRSLPPVNDTFCDDKVDGYYCANCLQPVYCNTSSAIPSVTLLPTCEDHAACEEFSNTLANCVESSSATYCHCEGGNPICDPYNETMISNCVYYSDAGYIVDNVTQCNVTEICRGEMCVASASCEGVADGTYVPYYPACNVGYRCQEGEVDFERSCPSGYYITNDGNCHTGPVPPCINDCFGNCPDNTDCSQYYFCDGTGELLSGPYECPENFYFNPNAIPPVCEEGDPSVCSPMINCEV